MFELQRKREESELLQAAPESVVETQQAPVLLDQRKEESGAAPAPQFAPTTMRSLSADPPPAAMTKAAGAGAAKGAAKTKSAPAAAPVEERYLRQGEKDIHGTHSDEQRRGVKGVVLDNASRDQLDETLSSNLRAILKDVEQYGNMDVTAAAAKKVLEESKLLSRIRGNLAKHLKRLKNPDSKEYRLTKMYMDYFNLDADGYLRVPQQGSAAVKMVGYPKPVAVNRTHEEDNRKKSRRVRMRSAKDESLFPHEPSINDIRQGGLGDCYLLAALASLINHDPQMIKDCMRDNGDGTATVRFYNKVPGQRAAGDTPATPDVTEAHYVRVEKSVPQGDDFARGSLWVQIIEKAYTASGLHNDVGKKAGAGFTPSYEDIAGGSASEFMFRITGRERKARLHSFQKHSLEADSTYMGFFLDSLVDHYTMKLLRKSGDGSADVIGALRRYILADKPQGVKQAPLADDPHAELMAMRKFDALRAFMKTLKSSVDAVGAEKSDRSKKRAYFTDVLRQEEFYKILLEADFGLLPDDLFTADQKLDIKERLLRKASNFKEHPELYASFSGQYSGDAVAAYEGMEEALERGDMVTCETIQYKPKGLIGREGGGLNAEDLDRGIAQGHAYTVLGVETRDSARLVRLRNPWGGGVVSYSRNAETGAVSRSRDMAKERDEGFFLMELNDFLAAFNEVSVN